MRIFKVIGMPFLFFVFSVAIAIGLLIGCSYLPQGPVDENVLTSAKQLIEEDVYIADHSYGSMMSLTSEALMLMESKSMNCSDSLSVLLNPRYIYGDELSAQENLLKYASGEEEQYIDPYSRYWMGFRATLRLLLQKLDYYQIRRYTAAVFFVLLFGAICTISKNVNSTVAFIFSASIILIRPHIIAVSLQSFTCCARAFAAILAVPWIWKHPKWESIFFMEVGIITMYFDFYTFPPLTLGLPLVYLYLLYWKENDAYPVKRIFDNSLSWLGGYVGMWLSKLIITAIFTGENSIAGGINQFLFWIQPDHPAVEYDMDCGPISALFHVALTLISGDNDGKHIMFGAMTLILVFFIIRFVYARPHFSVFVENVGLIVIALIPIIWFCVASKPTVVHHYFQYRSIAVSFFAGGSYLYICTTPQKLKNDNGLTT